VTDPARDGRHPEAVMIALFAAPSGAARFCAGQVGRARKILSKAGGGAKVVALSLELSGQSVRRFPVGNRPGEAAVDLDAPSLGGPDDQIALRGCGSPAMTPS